MSEERNQRHKKAMERRKALVDEKVAQATEERGILIVLTGNGKGKSSSGFGSVVRCLGHGYKAGIVQFIKGTWDCGERNFIEQRCPEVPYHVMGSGFTWETQDRDRDIAAAEQAWEKAEELLQDDSLHLVLLDELTYVLKYGWISQERIFSALQNRPAEMSVIVTGRAASAALRDMADTVAEVGDEKHAFRAGIKARRGIDW
ncbi:cob(I)yrinic acid a,c-diamide adenosyltransferase [Spongiibacter taiwanensis]|uniref:cob(I)yrinic acid a,c-diamide adenosyltransferase n=1 Tax=Spongiibacter taiwanensis TaxID=1748242 RepID=UPI0020351D66|nr:cob(I)yrinic acid a,c-diamide adenosyltransferase [Spongiibacter taiwanensis]USA44234.1 cob(I)yrinic acid a,c-diamide adenosyltransferase [Spongiibacter taiwanensis]